MSSLGAHGEAIAGAYIGRQHYQVLAQNLRIAGGELDLIALDQRCLVIIEVKARGDDFFGEPYEAVTEAKQRQVRRLAEVLLNTGRINEDLFDQVRFDVISIKLTPSGQVESLEHIKEAFF